MNDIEHAILEDISLEAPWALVETFSELPREHPDDVNRAADIIAERLRAHGVPVTMHEPDLYLSLPKSASVSAGGKTFVAKVPAFSVSAPEGVEAVLVYVPSPSAKGAHELAAKLAGASAEPMPEVAGKLVVSEGLALPGLAAEYMAAGAAGVIAVNPGARSHWGTVSTIWGSPGLDDVAQLPEIVAVAVNNTDGQELIALAKSGASARVHTELDCGWFESKLPVAEIPGSENPEQFVLLHGHYDSWDVGVSDNATGDACMLEIARVLWKHRDKLKRSVRVAWWPGHSTGRYAGSTWFADRFAIDLDENCVAHINCDSPGCRFATSYDRISMTGETEGFVVAAIEELTGQQVRGHRPPRAGDYAFNNIGISAYMMGSSMIPLPVAEEKGYYLVNGSGGNIEWHTEADQLEVADKDVLLKDIQVYLLTLLRSANAMLLPYDWHKVSHEFRDIVARYQESAGKAFDLTPARDAAKAFHDAIIGFQGKAGAGEIANDAANAVILRLARVLIPLNFARQPRFTHDPALWVPPLPALAESLKLNKYEGDQAGFAKTQLLRGQNRVVAALREATRLVSDALPDKTEGA